MERAVKEGTYWGGLYRFLDMWFGFYRQNLDMQGRDRIVNDKVDDLKGQLYTSKNNRRCTQN